MHLLVTDTCDKLMQVWFTLPNLKKKHIEALHMGL
jgi:hypothetical protein